MYSGNSDKEIAWRIENKTCDSERLVYVEDFKWNVQILEKNWENKLAGRGEYFPYTKKKEN